MHELASLSVPNRISGLDRVPRNDPEMRSVKLYQQETILGRYWGAIILVGQLGVIWVHENGVPRYTQMPPEPKLP